jgi:hypothetical protein
MFRRISLRHLVERRSPVIRKAEWAVFALVLLAGCRASRSADVSD